MSTIADLNPDAVLAALLDGKVSVQTSATQSHTIRAYADEDRPNKNLAYEFIDVEWNGGAQSLTEDPALFKGNLMLTIWCKAQTDGRAKKKLVKQIVAQIAPLVHLAVAGGYVFRFDPSQVITPTTTNLTTGFSTTILNVEWHTTDSEDAQSRPFLQSESGGHLLLEDNSQNKLTI